jgi:hypothetical protein
VVWLLRTSCLKEFEESPRPQEDCVRSSNVRPESTLPSMDGYRICLSPRFPRTKLAGFACMLLPPILRQALEQYGRIGRSTGAGYPVMLQRYR